MSKNAFTDSNSPPLPEQPAAHEHSLESHIPEHLAQYFLDVVQKLSLAADLETIMYIVRKAARKLTDADGATFVLRDGNMCYYAAEDAIAPLWQGKKFPMSICVSGWVMEHKQTIVIEDIYNDSRVPVEAYRPTFVKSLAMAPIRTREPIGAIGTYWAEKYHPTEEQVNLLKALADSTSIAMENINLHSELERGQQENTAQMEITKKLEEANKNLELTLTELNRRNLEMQYLKELSSKLQACIYIDEAYQLIVQYVSQLLPDSSGHLYLMHASRNYLDSMVSWASPKVDEKILKPDDCLALRRGSIANIENPSNELLCTHVHSNTNPLSPYTCVPLYAQSDIIGLLYIEWKNPVSDENKKKDNMMLIAMLAEQIALGISNIKLRETLRYQSVRDPLTGLYNRRYLEVSLEREINRCVRKSASIAVIMIDIDHFKRFNDEFGHEAGDLVIQSFADILTAHIRKSDIACRYGGEEFLLALSEVSFYEALERTKALHEDVRKMQLQYKNHALPPITISIGLAIYPQDGLNVNDMITAADTALYQAKNTGRNKTVQYKA